MTTIYKYRLEVTDTQWLELPRGAKPLSVGVQSETPVMWVQVDENAEAFDSRLFVTVGTGHPMKSDTMTFIGTYLLQGGRFVGHVFEPGQARAALAGKE